MALPPSFAPQITLDAVRFTIRGEERATVGCFGAMVLVPAVGSALVAWLDGPGEAIGLSCVALGLAPVLGVVVVQYLTRVHLVVGTDMVRSEKWVGPVRWRRRSVPLREIAAVELGKADMVVQRLTLTTLGGEALPFIADGHRAEDVDELVAFLSRVVTQAKEAPPPGAERPPPQALVQLLQAARGDR